MYYLQSFMRGRLFWEMDEIEIVQSCSTLFKNRRFSRENEGARGAEVEPLYKGGRVEDGRWREIS